MSNDSLTLAEPTRLVPNGTMIAQGDDSGLIVEFYYKAVPNAVKSASEGRPIFDDVVFVKILVPGDRNMSVDRKAKEEDRERFRPQWERFERGMAMAVSGTPLEQWAILTAREVAEMKAMNITTVEQMAGLSDAVTSKFNGLAVYRDKAKRFVQTAKEGAEAMRFDEQLRQRDDEIKRLTDSVAALTDAVNSLQNAAPEAAKSIRVRSARSTAEAA